jgi:hypothetical protein
MNDRFAKTVLLMVAAVILTVAGCEKGYKQDVLARGPDAAKLAVPTDYASRSLSATGGLQGWMGTKQLDLDCVVTLYQSDGSFYLTEQRYEVYPWSNAIRVSGLEPQGGFVWQLSAGGVGALSGRKALEALPNPVGMRDLAEAVRAITTAPVSFLDASYEFSRGAKPIRIEGQWYHSIERSDAVEQGEAQPYFSKVILRQNRDSSLVEMVWFANSGEQRYVSVRGYDFREVEKGGVLVPGRIEIFRTDAQGSSARRLVKIDLK